MVSCPYCKRKCTPMSLILVSKWILYKCPICSGLSQFSARGFERILGGIIAGYSYSKHQ